MNAEIGQEDYCVRGFLIPAVNFRATDYVDLFDWQAFHVTPLPVLRQISSLELLNMIQDDVPMAGWDFLLLNFLHILVKLVTEASRKRVGPQNRDGFIRATPESRKLMSQFKFRKDYKK
ncbi:hypothetical protein AVEN_235433-1 [Araneus ventricosus]|uniref:Uncharacterized protein n=1 Tax=Araneus ventricosus TaxID=182803 RepID=A0A4Y2A4N4_ARAVE|nr:hypothetical protein AVEN_235433-1 [Araneus ventricosus]